MAVTGRFKFQGISGFFFDFAEDQAQQNPVIPAVTLPSLGLLDKVHGTDHSEDSIPRQIQDGKPWQRFKAHVEALNLQDPSVTYKVLYITRHGFGHHNAVMAQVGRDAWNNHWSHLDGDGEIVWADSHLNDEGIEQVERLGRFWSDAIENEKIPPPGTIYTSPLARTLETTRLVFSRVMKDQGSNFNPIIKELLRERLTDHTCDRRSSLSWIKQHYPDFIVELGFSETDELWSSSRTESAEEHVARKQRLLEEIFEADTNEFIGLVTHSYAVSAILEAINMPRFRVREGSSVALLVKAERIAPTA